MVPLVKFYTSALKRHPRSTNALTTGVLFGIGDIIAQLQFPETPDAVYDPARTLRPFLYGAVFFSVIGDKWYNVLNNVVRIKGKPVDHWMNIVARVMCDQIIFAPIGLPMYFTCMTLLEGGNLTDIRDKLAEKWWPTLLANWTVWPAFQLCNFSIVPVQHRLLTVNVVSIFWNTFLSFTNSERGEEGLQVTGNSVVRDNS